MPQKANAASIPRSQKILGKANCLATDAVKDCVRITASKVGNLYQVAKVSITTLGDPPAVGIIIRKDSPTLCVVQFHGPMPGVYAGLTPGEAYLVGTDARLAKPGDPNYPTVSGTTYFQQMGVATSSGEFLVNPEEASIGGGSVIAARYYRQPLAGVINGSNVAFTTAIDFVHLGADKESVFHNGVLQDEGAGNDYLASESGGPGTGYDTITFALAPRVGDKISIDFVPAS